MPQAVNALQRLSSQASQAVTEAGVSFTETGMQQPALDIRLNHLIRQKVITPGNGQDVHVETADISDSKTTLPGDACAHPTVS